LVQQAPVQTSPTQPPKQREMPAVSRLQTAFLPAQQFCEAGSPAAPQMLPGGLQAVPPEHVVGAPTCFGSQKIL
jgi:hypothetical protein